MSAVLDQINRHGDIIKYAIGMRMQAEENRHSRERQARIDAENTALNELQKRALNDQYDTTQRTRNALQGLYGPALADQQDNALVGPPRPMPSIGQAGQSILAAGGDPQMGLDFAKAAPDAPKWELKQTGNGWQLLPTVPGQGGPVPTGADNPPPSSSVTTTINNAPGGGDNVMADTIAGDLPKLRQEAADARTAMKRLDNALDIVDEHGDSVVGWSGVLKRALSGPAAMAGIKIEGMDEAQILSSLLSEAAGSLRLAVVGPGPVSEYEQKILQDVSAKRISTAEGVRRILSHHRDQHLQKINSYNDTTARLSEASPKYKNAQIFYPRIEATERTPKKSKAGPVDVKTLSNEELLRLYNESKAGSQQ